MVTMQGPFALKQGGNGIAIRNPIFTDSETGERTFWGLSIVILKVPTVFQNSLESLSALDYDYTLETTATPLTDETVLVASSLPAGFSLSRPISNQFTMGGCAWSLSVQPHGGSFFNLTIVMIFTGIVLSLLFGMLTYLMIAARANNRLIQRSIITDSLTDLLNRKGFDQQLESFLADHPTTSATTVLLDIDDFKLLNDIYGHETGDLVLIDLAAKMRNFFPKDAVLARTGGDEFSIFIIGDRQDALIHEFLSAPKAIEHDGVPVHYTLSAGYAEFPVQSKDRSSLMKLADKALYASKLGGKNSSKKYEPTVEKINRYELGFTVKNIAAGLPGCFLVYKADEMEEILFANQSLISLVGCSDFDDFLQFTKSSFRNFVHPDDLERVNALIKEQTAASQETDNENLVYDGFLEYRINTRSGKTVTVLDVGKHVYDANMGMIFYVLILEKSSLLSSVISSQEKR